MPWFIIGIVLVVVSVVALLIPAKVYDGGIIKGFVFGFTICLAVVSIIGSSSLYVHSDEGGIVTKKFGSPLLNGHIIAVNGERGVQAEVLSPGWSFGWWPFLYDADSVKNLTIPEGKVGLVTAKDGEPLPEGETYAPAWDSPSQMVDAAKFMAGKGCRGPQLTVLPPAQYRYNPKLFDIAPSDVIDVKIGQVAVVRANAGKNPPEKATTVVNGVALVPKGCKGIWETPLSPGKYYMHPNAYQIVTVNTTKRVYSYTGKSGTEANTKADRPHLDNSIPVRTKDSFQFPVDLRVVVNVGAEEAPSLVALLGHPDEMSADGFDTMEIKAILPSIRAVLRNGAESEGALDYVAHRSIVEKNAFEQLSTEMQRFKIKVEAVYIADIRLDSTDEGKQLLTTQTNKQIALQQQAMYKQQVEAENERANQVKAKVAAEMQDKIQQSLASVEFEKNGAEAAKNKASGEAAAYAAKVAALGGVDNFVKLEIAKMAFDSLGKTWKGE